MNQLTRLTQYQLRSACQLTEGRSNHQAASPRNQVSLPDSGLIRAAGYCVSPAITRSIRSGFLAALTRKQTWRARLMTGKVMVRRQVLNFGTKFVTTARS